MSNDGARMELCRDLLDLAKNWTFGAGLAFTCNLVVRSTLPDLQRALATTVLMFGSIGTISVAVVLFMTRRRVTKMTPSERSIKQNAQVTFLLIGLVLAAYLVVDTTTSLVIEQLNVQRTSG